MLNKSISIEEKLIIDIIFSKGKLYKNRFENIDYEKIVNIASNHLILPTLYINLKNKFYLKYTPNGFSKYLGEIFEINKNRNINLVHEIRHINNLFNKHNIKHVFLKGSAHVICGLYLSDYDRMIGDIDILTNLNEGEKALNILKLDGYIPVTKKKFFQKNKKHFIRHFNPKKIFAVEIHTPKLLKHKVYKFNGENILNNSFKVKNLMVPSYTDQLYHNIYNFQINDYGYLNFNYALRSFYDSKLIIEKLNNLNFQSDKFIRSYFSKASLLGVNFHKEIGYEYNIISSLNFYFLRRNKFYKKIYSIIIRSYMRFVFLPKQLEEFFSNKLYRKYIINKIFKNIKL